MAEPRYATEEWRWVTSEDGLYRKLVAGPEPLPVPRVVLACGDIDAEDADLIKAAPAMFRLLTSLKLMIEAEDMPRQIPETIDAWDRAYEDISDLLAAARGSEVPDA